LFKKWLNYAVYPTITTHHDCLIVFFILSFEHQKYYIDILNIILIYFKTLNLMIISILWRHSRETTQKTNRESKFLFNIDVRYAM